MKAFPTPQECAHTDFEGMDLRDYFAAKAMQGMLASGIKLDIDGEVLFIGRAQTAYAIADAMMEARHEQTT